MGEREDRAMNREAKLRGEDKGGGRRVQSVHCPSFLLIASHPLPLLQRSPTLPSWKPVDVPRVRSEKPRHAAKTERGRTVIDFHVVLALGRASYWNLIVPVVLNRPGGSGSIVNLTVLDVGIVRIGALYKTARKRPSEKEAEGQDRVRKAGWAAREGRREDGQCSFRTGGEKRKQRQQSTTAGATNLCG